MLENVNDTEKEKEKKRNVRKRKKPENEEEEENGEILVRANSIVFILLSSFLRLPRDVYREWLLSNQRTFMLFV